MDRLVVVLIRCILCIQDKDSIPFTTSLSGEEAEAMVRGLMLIMGLRNNHLRPWEVSKVAVILRSWS